jgi:hypothetical protein
MINDNSLKTLTNSLDDYSRIISSDYRLQKELLKKNEIINDQSLAIDITTHYKNRQ